MTIILTTNFKLNLVKFSWYNKNEGKEKDAEEGRGKHNFK